MYGFTIYRPGAIFTYVVDFDSVILKEMANDSHRWDSGIDLYMASFVHVDEKNYQRFIEKFQLTFVDSMNDLNLLKKMINPT